MLTTGKWNKSLFEFNAIKDKRGYTLIELTVVVILIGVFLSLAVPRVRSSLLTDSLKSSTRRLISVINNLRGESVREYRSGFLFIDLDANMYWVSSPDMTEEERITAREDALSLPAGVKFQDVWLRGEGKKVMGEVVIRYNRKGYVQQTAIHLSSQGERAITLLVGPFMPGVKVLDGYVDFEEL